MKKTTIPRVYAYALIAIFALFPVLMIMVSNNDFNVEAVDLNATQSSSIILTERQGEVKEALSLCMRAEPLFSVKTSMGDSIYKDEYGYVFFEANDIAEATTSEPMTISGEEAARKVFEELFAYGIVTEDGYVAHIYPVIESTYNGEKDVFENDTVVYYEITIEKQASSGKPTEKILSVYNNGGLKSFGYYSE